MKDKHIPQREVENVELKKENFDNLTKKLIYKSKIHFIVVLQILNQSLISLVIKLIKKISQENQSTERKMSQDKYFSSRISLYDSFAFRITNGHSQDRWTNRQHSPPHVKGFSQLDHMDIELPQRRSDLLQSVLRDCSRQNTDKSTMHMSQNEFVPMLPVQVTDMEMTSQCDDPYSRSGQKNFHQCNCTHLQCNQQHCNCYLYPNEPCVVGLCCQKCIKLKNEYLNRQNEIEQSANHPGCLCKSIKCLKLYCKCFREGRKCNPNVCKCEGCENDVSSLLLRKQRKIQLDLKKDHQQSVGSVSKRQNFLLYSQKSTQLQVESANYSFINCSCKKSHCLKKYCSCFMHNKSCSQACACQECRNTYDENDQRDERNRKALQARQDKNYWGKFYYENNPYHNQIDQYLERDDSWLQHQQMNENMQFEPANFQMFMAN